MYRLVIETLLGITREIDRLRFAPRPPRDWKSFKIHYRYYDTTYHITFINGSGDWNGWPKVVVEGVEQPKLR
jgi:cellobiose phosphorylase